MIIQHSLLPQPYEPARSFYEVGIRKEALKLKPEWAGTFAPAAGADRKAAA